MNSIITGNGNKLEAYSNSIEKMPDLAQGSRFSSRIERRYSEEIKSLTVLGIDPFDFEEVFSHLMQNHPIDVSLRVLRQLSLHQLLIEDCVGSKPVEEVMQVISDLADFTLLKASEHVNKELEKVYGRPCNAAHEHSDIAIIAMGKLGAKELNVSSDVDLVYVYDEDGNTRSDSPEGKQVISNQEYYLKWAKGMQKQIGEVTEHGFVFRIDLALRPFGNSSASAISIGSLEDYFQKTARAWERFAWLKARIITYPNQPVKALNRKIYTAVEAYVFRPYVDYQLLESLREIHQKIQIQSEKNKEAHDLKLGRGGIREIEFGVQLFQVVQGGARAELRTRSTFKAIQYLQKYKLLSFEQAKNWEVAYRYLRTVEHRVQYLDDQQTHKLPQVIEDQIWIARTMGYAQVEHFIDDLDAICSFVQREFDQLLFKQGSSGDEKLAPVGEISMVTRSEEGIDEFMVTSRELMESMNDPVSLRNERGEANHDSHQVKLITSKWAKALGMVNQEVLTSSTTSNQLEQKRKWLIQLMNNCLVELKKGEIKAQDVTYWFEWMDTVLKRDNYLTLQVEHPVVQKSIIQLMSASSWCRRYLKYYPSVIEQLVNIKVSEERFNAEDFHDVLNQRQKTHSRNLGEEDEELVLKMLRREHHARLFKILIADLNEQLSIEEVSDDLSALADAVLSVCIEWIWKKIKGDQPLEKPPLAIIGYGKLGSKELGYGSDLDLVLLYDEEALESTEKITLLARKLISWVTIKTSDGDLYEIDNALRPNGSSGLLVSSFAAYEKYQKQLDLNSAWTWEHQALTRARFCFGSEALRKRFEQVRKDVLSVKREEEELKEDVFEMRSKLWASQKSKMGLLNGKFSPGGMVDVEFVVQYLILSKSNMYLELTENIGNIALLKLAEDRGLIPSGLGDESANAYRHLRKKQHLASLEETNLILQDGDLAHTEVVKKLWLQFFKPYW